MFYHLLNHHRTHIWVLIPSILNTICCTILSATSALWPGRSPPPQKKEHRVQRTRVDRPGSVWRPSTRIEWIESLGCPGTMMPIAAVSTRRVDVEPDVRMRIVGGARDVAHGKKKETKRPAKLVECGNVMKCDSMKVIECGVHRMCRTIP